MAVSCLGDCALLEQLGEKQDFECLLTEHGIRHEEFLLRVRRRTQQDPDAGWSSAYSVKVIRIASGLRHVYVGGPAHDWVERFAADMTRGVFGRDCAGPFDRSVPVGAPPVGTALSSERCTE